MLTTGRFLWRAAKKHLKTVRTHQNSVKNFFLSLSLSLPLPRGCIILPHKLKPNQCLVWSWEKNLGRDRHNVFNRHKPQAPPFCSANEPVSNQHVIPSNCQSIWAQHFIPTGNANDDKTVTSTLRIFQGYFEPGRLFYFARLFLCCLPRTVDECTVRSRCVSKLDRRVP